MAEKILIVDDEPDMLLLLSTILRDTESEVVTAGSPFEAFALVRTGGFDLVMTDLRMPGLDGNELLSAIRRFDPDIPVIIITAHTTADAVADAIANNAFDFISKPFHKEQILFAVDKALRWLRLQRETRMLRGRLDKKQ